PVIAEVKDTFSNSETTYVAPTDVVMDFLDGIWYFRTSEPSEKDPVESKFVEEASHDDIPRDLLEEGTSAIASK
ncbi:hypothetical protein KI387_025730, partial [Taxus chinensis]